MAASVTLQKLTRIDSAGTQDPAFTVDAGAYRQVAARLMVEAVQGTGTLIVELEHAVIDSDPEYENLLTFSTIANDGQCPSYEIKSTDDYARYLRWNVTTLSGITNAKFSIDLVLKS